MPTWGKIILSMMNLYKWEGINKALPEIWLVDIIQLNNYVVDNEQ